MSKPSKKSKFQPESSSEEEQKPQKSAFALMQ